MNEANSVTERLDRLERENRWLKLVGLVGLLGIAAVLLTGQGPASSGKVIEAEKFILRDASGRVRAELRAPRGGPAGLVLEDGVGRVRAAFTLAVDNTPGLLFLDQAGKLRVTLQLQAPGDAPILWLADKDQKARIKLSLSADGSPSFGLRGKNERPLMSLATVETGAFLSFTDETGRPRAALGMLADRSSGIELFNKDGKVIWKAP